MLTRVCKQCGIEKPLTEFHESKVHRGGRKPMCGSCYNWNHRSEKNKQIELEWRDLFNKGLKKCACCHKVLELEKFPAKINSRDGRKSYCYECQRIKVLDRSRETEVKRKKKERESTPEFLEHLHEYRKTSLVYNSPEKKAERIFRGRVRDLLWSCNTKRLIKYDELLGCTYEFLRQYIESLFQNGMNWDNNGRGEDKWHLDHIIPCAAFILTNIEQQKKCFHFSNLQPMWEPENLRKSSIYKGVNYKYKKSQ